MQEVKIQSPACSVGHSLVAACTAHSNSTNLVLLFWREHLVLSLCSVLHRFINFTQRILTLTKHNTGTMLYREQELGEAQKVLVDNRLICRICSI